MPPLPKTECPTCRKTVAVRRNGDLREHTGLAGQKCSGYQDTDLPLVTPRKPCDCPSGQDGGWHAADCASGGCV